MIPPNLRVRNRLALFLAVFVPLLAGAADDALRTRAFELYDAGKFAEARSLLERLQSRGEADGIALYRLFYCQQRAQDAQARPTLERARGLLEQAVRTSADLETYFYLTNAYANLSRADDARRVAAEATRKFEQGALPTPRAPVGMFRLAKLYADQDRKIEAVTWYGRAADGFEAAGDLPSARPYLQWASRYLAEQAFEDERYEEASRRFARVLEDGPGSPEDWDRFATAQAWIGRYDGAARAWRQAHLLSRGQSDRAHYGQGLAERAARTAALASAAPDGRPWDQLGRSELEQIMVEQANVVREALSWAARAGHELHFVERLALQQWIDEARSSFVAAALQHLLNGHPLRETAFSGGYAGLILREDDWSVRSARRHSPR